MDEAKGLGARLRELLPSFLQARSAEGISRSTLVVNERAIRRFSHWLEQEHRELEDLVQVSSHVLEDYALHLSLHEGEDGRHLKAASRATYLASLAVFFRWLEAQGKLLRNPAERLSLPKVPKPLPRGILSSREVERVMRVPDLGTPLGLRDRALLELFYASAVRHAELLALRIDALDFGEGLVSVRLGKGGKDRVVPMGTVAAEFLRRYLEEGRPALCRSPAETRVFLSRRSRPLSSTQLGRLLRRIGRLAGLAKHLTPHGLRHTCATHLLRGQADLRYIQEMLGHRSLQSTQIYTHVSALDLKRVHARCHPRERKR